ncbi:MAG: hypothetical protein WBP59_03860, partial [Ilumatobacteraceae bacterium]
GIAIAVTAYGVQQQLLFPIAELDPVFWLLAGVVTMRSLSMVSIDAPRRRSAPGPTAPLFLGAALLGLLATGAAVVGVRAVAADRWSLGALEARDVEVAIDAAARATELAPLDIRHQLLLARAHEQERSLGGVDRALAAVDDALTVSPLDPAVRFEHARLLSLRHEITGTDEDEVAAAQAWDELLDDEPLCERCRLGAAGN